MGCPDPYYVRMYVAHAQDLDVHYLETMPGEMARRIIALALLCFVIPNPGFGGQSTALVVLKSNERQTFVSTSSKVARSRIETADPSTSAIRTSPVVTVSAKLPEYIDKNGVGSVSSSKEFMSVESLLSTKALSSAATKPLLYVDEVSTTSTLVRSSSEMLTPVEKLTSKTPTSGTAEPSSSLPSKPLVSTSVTKTRSHTVTYTMSSSWISASPGPVSPESPTTSSPAPGRRSIDYKLILCVVVPLFTVLVFVIVIAMVLCIRRYRRLRRYRQHLVPLTDMDGSDDSDEEDQISDKEPVFMVSSVNSSARPILSFENEND